VADDDALAAIAAELGRALQPLAEATSSADAMQSFLMELGWDISPAVALVEGVHAAAATVYELVEGGDPGDTPDLMSLLSALRAAYVAVADIAGGAGIPAEAVAELPRQLADFLVSEYLLLNQPRWGHLLRVIGILQIVLVAETATRPAYTRQTIDYEGFADLVDDPLTFFRNAYGWGTPAFRGEEFAEALEDLALAWGLDADRVAVDPLTLAQLMQGALTPASTVDTVLRMPLVSVRSEASYEAGVGLFLLPETAAAKPGFAVLPYGSAGLDLEIGLSELLTLVIGGTVKLDGGVGALVRPDKDLEFLVGFGPGTPSAASGTLSISLVVGAGEPMVLLGDPEASRFELDGASALGGVRFHSSGKFEVYVEAAVEGARIVIQPGEDSDSFLSSLLPAEGLTIGTDLTVGFSTTQGLYFGGSGGLEIALPAHIQLGPVEIMSATIAVKFRDGGIPIELGATIKGDLSVLKAVVENIGITATVTFPDDQRGNLGPANLALGFKPPNGVGLAIDAGVVKGGGYLYLDFDKGEYAGALELVISNFLSLRAIGLINTKLPGGQQGFSMLVIITAEFSPGFQLGYGFTLIGVGGLLGLNRGMLLEPLANGIRTGAINSILFPTDIIANAPKIISDLRAIFPPKPDTFLIGPMAKIGWGTPTLISVALGVIIEIPGNVVILGRLKLALPTEDEAVVVLQLSFMGALEFDKRRIWFFASLYESRILFITLDGEMGLLMDFSDNPNFVLTVGGFHPKFTPPPLPFPSPTRLALSLIDESYARVRVETYFAVTTNSVQLGARAEAFFGFSALSVEGYFGFDALLRFSPFYFIVEISTGFSVKVFGMGVWGVHLRGALEGPTPWHITGKASIEFLFFSISVSVDEVFGERRAELLPPLPVLPALRKELEKLDSWRATIPGAGRQLVSLRELGDPGLLVLHPVGVLQVSQRFIPLNLPIDKVGNQKPSDITKATVTVDAGSVLAVRGPVRERFAAAQYRTMDDAAKLSAPAFEMFESGVELSAAGNDWTTGPSATRTVRYETIIIDTAFERHTIRFFEFWTVLFDHFAAGAAITKSPLSLAQEKKHQPFAAKVEVTGEQFTVANQADNTAVAGVQTFTSHAEAVAHVAGAVAADPALAGAFHVIPLAEVNVVA
jgi:Family of unknown function (DUF6603)